jgi:hypothetical protein
MSTLLLIDPTNPSCMVPERSRMRTRVWVRVRSHHLDQALASGVSPDGCAALSLRAHSLIGTRARGALARSLRRLVKDAQHPLQPLSFGVPICRRKILASRNTLEALATRLDSRDPLDAGGVAKVKLLLSNGGGPVYGHGTADDLEPALREALDALTLPPAPL